MMESNKLTAAPKPGTNIIWRGHVHSYESVTQKIDALKSIIRSLKIKGASLVGLLVPRSEWQIICPIAVLECNQAYVPINTAWPIERIQNILNRTTPAIVITDKAFIEQNAQLFQGYSCHGACGSLVVFAKEGHRKDAIVKNVAYIIFTSGTTGSPKGVTITRDALQSFKEGFGRMMALEEGKSILSLAEYSFDMFVPEGVLALSWGLDIIIAESMDIVNPRRIVQILLKHRPDYMQITPSALGLISMIDPGLDSLASISKLMVGAESFPEDLFGTVKRGFKGAVYNLYGPTEATVWCCGGEITKEERIHIGKELGGCEIAIIGEGNRKRNSLEEGEICIAGMQLAEGYWDNGEENEKKFFCLRGKRFYRSGDIGYRDKDGSIICLGRKDDQIKLHGYRIELGEIESVSRKFSGVADALAALDNKEDGKRLVVFLITNGQFEEERFWAYLEKQLPAYGIPEACIRVNGFAYSENGKADRKKMLVEFRRDS